MKVAYAGVNYIDVYTRDGLYARSDTYKPTHRRSPMAGKVLAPWTPSDPGSKGVAVGDRVAWCLVLGAYAEYACVPAWRLVKLPDGVSRKHAVTLMLQGCTAHYLSHSLFPLEPGHSVLVHAGAGGVGQLLVQLAKLRGAEVFATVGNQQKADRVLALGADHAILYQEEDFAQIVLDNTLGQGVDVVYDSVGAATIDGSIRCCKRRGTVCNFGAASGAVTAVDPLELAEAGSVFFTRPHKCPFFDASSTASLSSAVTSAPCFINNFTISKCPSSDAILIAKLSPAVTSAPCFINNFITSICLYFNA